MQKSQNIAHDTLSQIEVEPQKKIIINAVDVAFKIVPKVERATTGAPQNISSESLYSIQNIQKEEAAIYANCMEIIYKTKLFLSGMEKTPLSENSFLNFHKELWRYINELELQSECATPVTKYNIQKLFRGELYEFITQSTIASRALTKPMGYPGDYIMLQYLYDNKVRSETEIGCYFDKFFFEDTLAKAVVNRVQTMSQYIEKFIEDSPKSELHILDIASGSGFDLIPIAKKKQSKKIFFHCFDQEIASLWFAKNNLESLNNNVSFIFYKEDIRHFFKKKESSQTFDLVYNIGLADYLPDKILKVFMQESIDALNPGGQFILAHKDFEKFQPEHPSWLYDWQFIKRNFSDYINFVNNNLTNFSHFETFFESDLKVIYFGKFIRQ